MSTTISSRLAALGKTPDDLFAESAITGEANDTILERWEGTSTNPAIHLRFINDQCHIDPPITAVRRINTSPPLWELDGPLGTTRLTTNQLGEARYAKIKIAEITGRVPVLARGFKWDTVFQAFINAASNVEVADLGSDASLLAEWLGSYLEHAPIVASLDEAAPMRCPYANGDTVTVFSTSLRQHIEHVCRDKVTRQDLAVLMRTAGADHDTVFFKDGGRTSARVFHLGPDLHGRGPSPVDS